MNKDFIDNTNIILPLIYDLFSSDEFYFLQIIKRKDGGIIQYKNHTTLKTFYIKCKKDFIKASEECVHLCNLYGARAYINLNRRSFKQVACKAMAIMCERIEKDEFQLCKDAYNSACGLTTSEKNHLWLIDIDFTDKAYKEVVQFINRIEPVENTKKVIAEIPSMKGVHLISYPFRLDKFKERFPDIEVHKNNPTNLYIPHRHA